MAVIHTINVSKSDEMFADAAEARAAIRTVMNNEDYHDELGALQDSGALMVAESFDAGTQTYTLVRTWQDDAYATWGTATTNSDSIANKSALEAAGYTVTSSIG